MGPGLGGEERLFQSLMVLGIMLLKFVIKR